MTRAQALDVVRSLALGLAPDLAGCSRLLERIAGHDDAEALRDALTMVGVERTLEDLVLARAWNAAFFPEVRDDA